MTLTNRHPETICLAKNCTRWVLLAGCVLLLPPSIVHGQTDPFFAEPNSSPSRPPSRVLQGGEVDPNVRRVWRLTERQDVSDDSDVPSTPAVDPIPMNSLVPNEEKESVAVGFVEDVPQTPVFVPGPMLIPDCGHPWPSRRIPNMMGDFFGAGRELLRVTGDELLNASPTDTFNPAALGMGNVTEFLVVDPGSSVLGRQKPSENNSPWTRDRAFFNYTYLDNTSLQDGGVGVHRMVPGVERTFANGLCSWEFRMPVGITFDSESILTGGSSRDQAEFGNIYLGTKVLLCSSSDVVVAAGLGGNFPTANDLRFKNLNGRELVRVENSAVHVMPYLTAAWSEEDRGWFAQSFLQLDYDANGNPILIDNGTELSDVGDFKDATYLNWDIAGGYWLIKDRCGATISGIAPTMEIHYNTALDTPDGVRSDSGFQFGVNRGQVEVVNLLLGVTLELASRHSLAIGYGTPVGGGNDEQFDSQLRILLNCNFGGQ